MAEGQGNSGPDHDYTGSGVDVIETDEQLEAFLASQGELGDGEGGDGEGQGGSGDGNPPPASSTGDGEGSGEGAGDGTGDGAGEGAGDGTGGEGDGAGEGAGTGDGEGDGISIGDGNPKAPSTEYKNAVHYLDQRFGLKMNLEQIPEDMDAAAQAQLIGDLFERLQNGTNAKLSEFQDVQTLLNDKEIKDFIDAKKKGKTLKDYVTEYSGTTEGMGDEELIMAEFRVTMPNATEEQLKVMLEGIRNTDKIAETASTMREARKVRETKQAEADKAARDLQEQQDEQKRQGEVQAFGVYLKRVNDVYGVPLTDQMRNQVFEFATKLDDKGLAPLDHALQSDQGTLLATLGLIHLKTLMQANATTKNNRATKKLVDKLFDTTDPLQGAGEGSGQNTGNEADEIAAINQM